MTDSPIVVEPLRKPVSRDDVHQAADALLIAGQQPTVERVRQHLGRGSPNTVGPHLKTWFATLGERIANPDRFAAVPSVVNQAAEVFWQEALNAATQRAREALQGSADALQRERDELTARAAVLDEQERRQSAASEAQAATMAMLQEQVTEGRGRIAELMQTLTERTDAAAEALGQLRAANRAQEALREQLDVARVAADQERRDLIEQMRSIEANLLLERGEARDLARNAQARAVKAEQALAKQTRQASEAMQARQQEHALQARAWSVEKDHLDQALASQLQEIDRLRAQVAAAADRVQAHQLERETFEKRLEQLLSKVEHAVQRKPNRRRGA